MKLMISMLRCALAAMAWMSCVTCTVTAASADGGIIKLSVLLGEFGETTPLEGASVECYDQDASSKTAITSPATTGKDGVAELEYGIVIGELDSRHPNPNIICKVMSSDSMATATPILTMYTDTHWNCTQDPLIDLGTLVVAPDRQKRGDIGDANGCGPASLPEFLTRLVEQGTGMGLGCTNHDYCYSNCLGETQKTCDDEARRIWRSECERKMQGKTAKTICKEGLAEAMYMVVTGVPGDMAYRADQIDKCKNTTSNARDGANDDDEYHHDLSSSLRIQTKSL
ncbi:expressed unknown protein [Seminavis robusta]|uniref:Uncharacterized protein n=1 Tax=Seminavis robusta TaxID=568900 RepID=A0A9N8DRL3_9STRA|nr:expressed unknown protein [Seminavis robusta]|eukprot:Sro290_g109250.1 n/a (284) ;mRNA; f:12298-13364